MKTIPQILSAELNQPEAYIQNVIALLDEGNTIPFIARYRKEAHGAMDDTTLRALETRLQYLKNLQARRDEVKSSIESQGKLTDELSAAIDEAATLAEVEDLYRPYKQKRRTRATVAREKGLEPLAEAIFAQTRGMAAPDVLAQDYLDAEKGVETIADALQGANDIIAEWISDDAAIRKSLRELMEKRRHAPLPRRDGGGQRLPPVLRLFAACCKAAGPSDSRHQPRREGGKARRSSVDCWTAIVALPTAAPRGGEARLQRNGVCQGRRRGRLRPPDLSLAGAGDARCC